MRIMNIPLPRTSFENQPSSQTKKHQTMDYEYQEEHQPCDNLESCNLTNHHSEAFKYFMSCATINLNSFVC